jgi:hypothetical protein
VLFGGNLGGLRADDTWVFANDTWTQLATTAAPPPRDGHRMVYDRPSGRVLLIAGDELGRFVDDLWTLDGDTWNQIQTVQKPPPRARGVATYDTARARVVVFGGQGRLELADTWSFSLVGLAPRETCSADFDADGDGLVACDDPDCAGFCTPACSPYSDRYVPGAPLACDLTVPFCGDGTCQPPRESSARCPGDCS